MKLLKLPMTIVLVLSMAAVVTAETYNTPTTDGAVAVAPDDWDVDELAADDPDTDCRYTGNPDLDDLYITWDADSLYVGLVTAGPPSFYGNGYLLYIDFDAQNGVTGSTDFTSADYFPRRITLSTMGADVIMGSWNLATPFFRFYADPMNTTPVPGARAVSAYGVTHIEGAIPWNGLYGLGRSNVPAGTVLRFIGAIVGPDNSGAYDAIPTTTHGLESDPATPCDAYTDLDVFEEAIVDADYDGIPDAGYSVVEPLTWGRIKALFAD